MKLASLLLTAGFMASASAQDNGKSDFLLPADMSSQTVLYVGAHPDDE